MHTHYTLAALRAQGPVLWVLPQSCACPHRLASFSNSCTLCISHLPLQLHSAAPHQALLARFHAALQHITGWRVVVTANTPAPPHDPEADATADTDCAAARNPGTAQPPGNPAAEPQQHTTQAAAAGPSLASTSASDSPGSSNCSSSRRPVAGYPAALTMQALLSGGWAVGCVEMQQQEQSCWVRFNLPRELVRTPAVLQALNKRELVRTTHAHACGASPPQIWH